MISKFLENEPQNFDPRDEQIFGKIQAGLEIHSMDQIFDILTFIFLIFQLQKPIAQLLITFLECFHGFLII